MNLATIQVSGVQALVREYETVPAGIVGATVTFEFTDPRWDDLTKTAVFRGCVTRDTLMEGDTVRVPSEVVAQSGPRLMVGVFGVDSEGNLQIPTLWASLGVIRPAANPSWDPGTDPDPPIWAQLQKQIKDLKENGFSVDDDKLEEIVQKYLKENPPTQFDPDEETLSLEENVLAVKTTNEVIEDDPRPITSGAVYDEFSKAVALLKTI